MGLIESLDSLLMVHPWQHAQGFGFGVYLNTILERSTTRVQWVRLNSLILCWWCIHGSMPIAMALVSTSTPSWKDQPHAYNGSGWIHFLSVDGASMAACRKLWLWCVPQHNLGERSTTRVQQVRLNSLILCWWYIHGSMPMAMALVSTSTPSWRMINHTHTSVDGAFMAACWRLWL